LSVSDLVRPDVTAGWPEIPTEGWRVIVAVAFGNALEWFEIVIYGYFAAIIAQLLFPSEDPTAALLLTLASFGVTFIMRPLGAVVLGGYADRYGRKKALQISIILMTIGSVTIAVVPVYHTIGFFASVIVLLARLVQGFSVGGEFGSATAFFAEQDRTQRGYYTSWQFASQGLSAVLATGVGTAITSMLSLQQIIDWGWRIPFVFGVVIAPIGFYIRKHVTETMDFRVSRSSRSPVRAVLVEAWRSLLISFGLVVLGTVAMYTILFMPTYAVRELSLPMPNSFAAGLLTGILQFIFIPMFGALSDRIGRTPIPILAAATILLSIYPTFAWLSVEPTVFKLLLVQGLLGIVTAAYLGALPAMMSELFPRQMRSTGLSISYALGVAIFGGFAPFIHVWMIAATGNILAPTFYVVFAAVVSLVSLFAAHRLEFR
jgi:MHS family proline/betaine transporter-like MFS transporter